MEFHTEKLDDKAEYVGLCDLFPGLSWIAPTEVEALGGIEELALKTLEELAEEWEKTQAKMESLLFETELEDDGRWIASVVGAPGVMVYGDTRDEALALARKLYRSVLNWNDPIVGDVDL